MRTILAFILLTSVASAQSNWVQQWPKQIRATAKVAAKVAGDGTYYGSGVCIDKRGYVLTVAHALLHKNATYEVTLNGRKYPADLVYVDKIHKGDGAGILKIRGPPEFPAVDFAASPTKRGEAVFSFGYPLGKFRAGYGVDTGREIWQGDSVPRQYVTWVNFEIDSGWSGGPLFNRRGEVVGIAESTTGVSNPGRSKRVMLRSRSNPGKGSGWVKLAQCRLAYQTATGSFKSEHRKTLYVFTADNCRACQKWYSRETALRRDWAAQGGGEVVYVNLSRASSAPIRRQYETATGRTLDGTPLFWVEGTSRGAYETQIVAGTVGAISVASIIRWAVQSIARFLVGRARDRIEDRIDARRSRPEPDVPAVATTLFEDWSGITVLAIVAKQDVGFVRGKGREALLKLSRGRVERRVREMSKGKARLLIVSERLNSAAYEAVLEAAGLAPPERGDVLVLVPKQNTSLVKSLIHRKIAAIAEGKLKDAPVEVIFERLHAAEYAGILKAAQVPTPAPDPVSDTPVTGTVVETLKAAAVEAIVRKVIGESDSAGKIVAAISGTSERQEKQNVILQLIMSVFGSMWGLERIFTAASAWRSRKASTSKSED